MPWNSLAEFGLAGVKVSLLTILVICSVIVWRHKDLKETEITPMVQIQPANHPTIFLRFLWMLVIFLISFTVFVLVPAVLVGFIELPVILEAYLGLLFAVGLTQVCIYVFDM